MRISRGTNLYLWSSLVTCVAFCLVFNRLLIIITINMLLWDLGVVFLQFPLTLIHSKSYVYWISVLSEHEWSLQIALDPLTTWLIILIYSLQMVKQVHRISLIPLILQFSSVQSLSRVRLFATPWIAARQASLSITNPRSSPRLTSIESVMPSSHLILCRPLLLLSPIPPSIRVFSSESTLCMRWPKNWSFSFSMIPSKEIPGPISFTMDWLDLLAVQGTLKSLLQHHSSKASILRRSAFFVVQLSHPYMTTGKTIALTRRTFVGKVMSLLLNMLSRLFITFLPRSKRLLISWLQSPSVLILEPRKIKSDTVSTVSPSISHEVVGPDAMIWFANIIPQSCLLIFLMVSLEKQSKCFKVTNIFYKSCFCCLTQGHKDSF